MSIYTTSKITESIDSPAGRAQTGATWQGSRWPTSGATKAVAGSTMHLAIARARDLPHAAWPASCASGRVSGHIDGAFWAVKYASV